MKIGQLSLFAGVLAAVIMLLPGCHGSPQHVAVTRQNFGYPGMPLPANYAQKQAAIATYMATHPHNLPAAAAASVAAAKAEAARAGKHFK